MEMVGVMVGLDSKGELDLLCGDDETVPEAELVVEEAGSPSAADSEETPDPCFGEGSDSGSMGSLRLLDCVAPALRKEGSRALLYPQYVVKNTASS